MLDHNISDNWSFQVGASTVFYEFPNTQTVPVAQIGPTQFFRLRQSSQNQESSSSLIANVAGDVDVLGLNHKILAGTEQVYYDSEANFRGEQVFEFPLFNAANPSYNNILGTAPAFAASFPVFRQVRHGYYLQDYVTINDYWQVLGGVRFDDVDLTFQRDLGLGPTRTEQRFMQTTPRAGIVFQPIPELLSTYFNFTQSFSPPGGGAFPFTNQQVAPELGKMYEAGIKALLMENLSFRAAGFSIERSNVPFADFGALGPVFFQVGQERSQGAELELVGNLSSRSSIIANYAYTDTELIDANNPDIFGQRQRNVPLNQANVWGKFDLLQRPRETFGLAMGMIWVDERSANLEDTVSLPSYVRWDSGIYYRRGRMYGSLFAENIFDRQYAQSSINEFQIFQGSPAAIRIQLGARF